MELRQLTTNIPAGATTRRLDVWGHVLAVATNRPEAADLLADTFYPAGMFQVREAADGPVAELTIVDHARPQAEVDELIRSVSATGRESDYELTRNYRLPRFDTAEGTLFVLRDVNHTESAALLRTEGRVTIVRPETPLGHRWLTRIVRDLATRFAKASGSLVLHSSAFTHDGGAYLVIGDSGAGKSTTAIALARLLSLAGWMGNDRMHLDREGAQYRATACPLPLAINKGSLDVMGVTDFQGWTLHAGFPAAGSDWDRFMGEDKLKMSTREVERYLEVPIVPEAPLAGVLFPRVDPSAPYAFGEASLEHAADVLSRNCFSVDDNLQGEDWLGVTGADPVAPPTLEAFLADIAKLPLLRSSVGNAADVTRLAADFRRAVTAER
ncbi:hypothetical protein M8C13_31410 [Crossiella sp. SN42]|uniref:hypothetical protein n=1 Tax=Crossiella sp. SN42 TaxID=2944808 RepID=UPI00207CEBE8|nr:hypothetical protein [Crossiella sp. SN42]MCO1580274.1 hypothetical protein [Crossiella sp. SN42]